MANAPAITNPKVRSEPTTSSSSRENTSWVDCPAAHGGLPSVMLLSNRDQRAIALGIPWRQQGPFRLPEGGPRAPEPPVLSKHFQGAVGPYPMRGPGR